MESQPSIQSLATNQTVNASKVLAFEINAMSSDKGKNPKKLGSKNKGKDKKKNENPPQEK